MCGWETVPMKKIVSWVTLIAGLIAGCALFSGIVRDQCEIAPYRPLIDSLRNDKPGERLQAVLELGVLRLGGQGLKMAVLPLAERLDDPDGRVREAAADTLAWFGPDAAPAMATLVRIIRDDQSGLRARAIRVVCLIDSDESRLILAEAMTDPDPGRRIETVKAVGDLYRMAGSSVPRLLANLKLEPAPAVRRAILNALVAIEPASDRVSKARLEAMSDEDPETRKAAVAGFGSPGPMTFISHLRQAAGDPDVGVRIEAIRMLSQIGLRHPEVVPILCQALVDPVTRDESRIAISHLDWIPPSEAVPSLDAVLFPAVPALFSAAKQADPKTRGVVVSLLCRLVGHFDRETPPLPTALRAALPQLLDLVNDAEPIEGLYVMLALLDEPPSALLLPLLLLHHGPGTRGKPSGDQANSLQNEWRAAIAAVSARLRAGDLAVKTHILVSLLPEYLVESLLPTVITATTDDDPDVRLRALTLLGDIAHQQASEAADSRSLVRATLPAIMAALQSRFPEVREHASLTLGGLGAIAAPAVPALREMLAKENDPKVHARAEQSLRSIAAVSKPNAAP
jgi:HEAT repeat protein